MDGQTTESPICRTGSHPGLGRSLFVNLSPRGRRMCSFDCVFCTDSSPSPDRALRWPTPGEVCNALENRPPDSPAVESITILSRGEPTLHPRFGAVVAEVLGYAGRARPALPVRILTNGSQAGHPVVGRLLDNLDERIVKLDAAGERVNRPRPGAKGSAEAACEMRDPILHSCFVEGDDSNCDPESVSNWVEQVREIHPRIVRIHTIRPETATPTVRAASEDQLCEIASLLRSTSIETDVVPWIPRSFASPSGEE